MENCAFIDLFTTMNDLCGGTNCPVQFRCEISDWDGFRSGAKPRTKQLNMVPDEKIPGNGTAFHGYSDESIRFLASPEGGEKWLSLKDGLAQARHIVSSLVAGKVYLVGYGLKGFLFKVLNAHFSRVLGEPPVELDKDRTIDVERFSKLVVDVRDCGNYTRNSVMAALLPGKLGSTGTTIQVETAKTRAILQKLVEKAAEAGTKMESFADIAAFLNSKHRTERFQMGKYKGLSVDEVFRKDKEYFSWILKNRKFYENDPELLEKVSDLMNSEEP